MRVAAIERIKEIGENLDPDAWWEILPIAKKQIVAICRALVGNIKVLIMDEPTSSLTSKEVAALFKIVRRLVAAGVTVVFWRSIDWRGCPTLRIDIFSFEKGSLRADWDAEQFYSAFRRRALAALWAACPKSDPLVREKLQTKKRVEV